MWVKGQSGNPGGRPKGWREIAAAAREHTREALDTLVKAMREADKWAVRVKAAELIIERGHGKAMQAITLANETNEMSDAERADMLAAILVEARNRGSPVVPDRGGESAGIDSSDWSSEDGQTH